MSPLTFLLLFITGAAILVALFRARPKARTRRLEDWEESKMELGAKICEAAARDAFDVRLDHTDESLKVLDSIIAQGWTTTNSSALTPHLIVTSFPDLEPVEEHDEMEDAQKLVPECGITSAPVASPKADADEHPFNASLFVTSSYFGNVLVLNHDAEWRLDTKTHRWPFLYFKEADLATSPFDILKKKFEDPAMFSIAEAYERLLEEVGRRKHIRATTHSEGGSDAISFSTRAVDVNHTDIHSGHSSTASEPASTEMTPIEPPSIETSNGDPLDSNLTSSTSDGSRTY